MVQLWLERQRRKKGTSKKVGIKGWIDRKRKKKKGEEMGVLNRPVYLQLVAIFATLIKRKIL